MNHQAPKEFARVVAIAVQGFFNRYPKMAERERESAVIGGPRHVYDEVEEDFTLKNAGFDIRRELGRMMSLHIQAPRIGSLYLEFFAGYGWKDTREGRSLPQEAAERMAASFFSPAFVVRTVGAEAEALANKLLARYFPPPRKKLRRYEEDEDT